MVAMSNTAINKFLELIWLNTIFSIIHNQNYNF